MKGLFIVLAVAIALLIFMWKSFFDTLEVAMDDIESAVGEKVVLEGDTLMITDFSIWRETYILSDGREVNGKLLPKILIE